MPVYSTQGTPPFSCLHPQQMVISRIASAIFVASCALGAPIIIGHLLFIARNTGNASAIGQSLAIILLAGAVSALGIYASHRLRKWAMSREP